METNLQAFSTKKLIASQGSVIGAMNKQGLSDWVKSERDRGLSDRALGRSLNVSGVTIGNWFAGAVNSLKPETVAAIASYRDITISEAYRWLDLPEPLDASNSARIEALEQNYAKLLNLLTQINEKLHSGGFRPSPLALFIQDELYKAHYDLRTKVGYDQFLDAAVNALDGDRLLAQRVMSQLIGAMPIERDDCTFIALAMREVLGSKWTTRYVIEESIKAKEREA